MAEHTTFTSWAAANLGESVKNAYLDLQLINAKYKEANPPLPHCGLKTIPLVVQALFPKASYRNEKFWGLTVRPKEYPDPSTITLPPNCKFKQVDGILRIDCPTKYIFDGKTVVGHIRIHQNLALDVKMLEKQIELPNFGISKTLQRISQNELSGIVHIVQQANVCIGLLYDAQKHDEHIMNLLKVVKRDVALGEKSEKREARLFSERCNIWVKMTKDPSECTMCQSCCEVFKNFSDPASGGESSVKTKPSPAKKLVEEVSSLPSGKRSKADPPLLQKVARATKQPEGVTPVALYKIVGKKQIPKQAHQKEVHVEVIMSQPETSQDIHLRKVVSLKQKMKEMENVLQSMEADARTLGKKQRKAEKVIASGKGAAPNMQVRNN